MFRTPLLKSSVVTVLSLSATVLSVALTLEMTFHTAPLARAIWMVPSLF